MSSSIKKKQGQFIIILLPSHQNISFNVAFPNSFPVTMKNMWAIGLR